MDYRSCLTSLLLPSSILRAHPPEPPLLPRLGEKNRNRSDISFFGGLFTASNRYHACNNADGIHFNNNPTNGNPLDTAPCGYVTGLSTPQFPLSIYSALAEHCPPSSSPRNPRTCLCGWCFCPRWLGSDRWSSSERDSTATGIGMEVWIDAFTASPTESPTSSPTRWFESDNHTTNFAEMQSRMYVHFELGAAHLPGSPSSTPPCVRRTVCPSWPRSRADQCAPSGVMPCPVSPSPRLPVSGMPFLAEIVLVAC